MQYPANVKVLDDAQIKFPGNLGVVKAKIYRELVGKLKTVTSKMTDGRYYASLLMDDGIVAPELSSEGKAIGIDLGVTDFAVTSEG